MASASVIWTIDDVAERFQEAVHTGHRLPPVRVPGYTNPWPTIVQDELDRFADLDPPPRRCPPEPVTVDRMIEAMRWMQWLTEDRRHLVWMRADQVEWHVIAKCFACDRSTAWRRWRGALQTVADKLNASA